VRDPRVTDMTFLLPSAQVRQNNFHVDEAVDLHDVNSLPPQALLRQTQALQGVAFVAQVFTCRPDLVRDEDLVVDPERRRKVADANFTGTVNWGRINDTRTTLPIDAD
jgi:hypothetical protein